MRPRIASYGECNRILKKYGLSAKKSLGQNFLIDYNIIEKIVKNANITENDVVIEVGPGLGALTQGLVENAGQVLALELDDKLVPILGETFNYVDNLTVVHQDVMKANIPELLAPLYEKGEYNDGFIVAANLPYYITTPIMMLFLESDLPWRRLVFMVQKEVADRIVAKADCKEYGAISVAVQYRCEAKIAVNVPPQVFVPRPKVGSAVIVLERREKPAVPTKDEKMFFRVVKAAFGMRRKNLLNSLSGGLSLDKESVKQVLEMAGIDSNRRGESLNMEEFAKITDAIIDLK